MIRDDDQDTAGRDGLRGTGGFHAGGGEEPPPALDAVILQAAREALREERARGSRQRLLWPLAASVLLSTTAVLLFGPDAPQPESAALVTEEALRPRTLEAAGRAGEALPRAVSSEVPPLPPAQAEPRRAAASTAAEAQAVQESGPPPPAPARGAVAVPLQQDAPSPQPVQDSAQPGAEEVIANGFRIRQLPPDRQPAQEAGPMQALEEIAVSGARIRPEASDAPPLQEAAPPEALAEIVATGSRSPQQAPDNVTSEEAAPAMALEEIAATGSRSPQQAPDRVTSEEAAPATALEEIAVAGTRIVRGPRDSQPVQESVPAEEQEEIIVTGSRIRLAEPAALPSAPTDFSEDPDLWRTAIRLLLEAGLLELARAEREQFVLRYPELDPGPWPEAVEASQEP